MAVNKVIYDGNTLIDITDTTAGAADVVPGTYFYTAAGVRTEGTAVIPTKTSDLVNDSGYITGMYIAGYGKSTYAEVLAAYQANKVVYCRASSGSNPASGNQLRMAFLAYVNSEATPTEFEFQYYRSVSSHTATQQGDQVYVYKLNKTSGWSVTIREAYTKIVAGTGMSSTYTTGVSASINLAVANPLPAVTSNEAGYILKVNSNGQWEAMPPT